MDRRRTSTTHRRGPGAAIAVLLVGGMLAGCGSSEQTSETAGSATDACAPLVAVKASATKILADTPASTSPKGSTPSADAVPGAKHSSARAITALASQLGPVADQLDKIASSSDAKSDAGQTQVEGLLTAELALRRVQRALLAKQYTEASIASEDFHNAAKAAGLNCASPLGDDTRVEMSALPTH